MDLTYNCKGRLVHSFWENLHNDFGKTLRLYSSRSVLQNCRHGIGSLNISGPWDVVHKSKRILSSRRQAVIGLWNCFSTMSYKSICLHTETIIKKKEKNRHTFCLPVKMFWSLYCSMIILHHVTIIYPQQKANIKCCWNFLLFWL